MIIIPSQGWRCCWLACQINTNDRPLGPTSFLPGCIWCVHSAGQHEVQATAPCHEMWNSEEDHHDLERRWGSSQHAWSAGSVRWTVLGDTSWSSYKPAICLVGVGLFGWHFYNLHFLLSFCDISTEMKPILTSRYSFYK